jgi:hypothetical protein
MRLGLAKIILAEVGMGQSDPEVVKQRVIEAFRRGRGQRLIEASR